jgi:hypothetical protein
LAGRLQSVEESLSVIGESVGGLCEVGGFFGEASGVVCEFFYLADDSCVSLCEDVSAFGLQLCTEVEFFGEA